MHIQYGEWKINADIKRTKSYYSEFKKPTDQYSRNFQMYCEGLSAEEKSFFDSFGIDPQCVRIESLGETERGLAPSGGYYYVFGSYESAPEQPDISLEQLMKEGFGNTLRDTSVKIGGFRFEFQRVTDPHSDIPDGMPADCLCIRFFCENMKWLLNEKSNKTVKPPSVIEKIFARLSKRFTAKCKKNTECAYDGGMLLTATCF